MNTKSPECYTIDPQVHSLRVELPAARSVLLPFDQFAFSELTGEDKDQKLRLVFATHEVLISGYALRRVEIAMQRLELSFITPLPVRYHSLLNEGQPKIRDVVVIDVKDAEIRQKEN